MLSKKLFQEDENMLSSGVSLEFFFGGREKEPEVEKTPLEIKKSEKTTLVDYDRALDNVNRYSEEIFEILKHLGWVRSSRDMDKVVSRGSDYIHYEFDNKRDATLENFIRYTLIAFRNFGYITFILPHINRKPEGYVEGELSYETENFFAYYDHDERNGVYFLEISPKIHIDTDRRRDDRKRIELRKKFAEEFFAYSKKIYDDVDSVLDQKLSDVPDFELEYMDISSTKEPYDLIKDYPSCIFTLDDGSGNSTGVCEYKGELFGVDWDHETRLVTFS